MPYQELIGQQVKLEWCTPTELTPQTGSTVFTEFGVLRGIENEVAYLHTDKEEEPLQAYPLSSVWNITPA